MKKLVMFLLRMAGAILFAGENNKQPRKFTYCSYSDTIRLMPQNYMVATKHKGYWLTDTDAAIDDRLSEKIFPIIRKHAFNHDTNLILHHLNRLVCR